ncbi:MAG TPA: hypothetical protein VJ602_01320 [Paludibacter sp.]|nr:hypothetical protein [Paludibacter sp.]
MARFNHFLYGLVPGLLLPLAFMWAYLNRFYPGDLSFFETLKLLYPGILLGKLLLLSVMPNLVLVFVFYKSDSFKIAAGMLLGGMPYFIGSIFML